MGTITSGHSSVWTPEVIVALNRAYAEASGILQDKLVENDVKVKIAEHMMYLARNGETDEQRLCSLSVIAVLGRNPMAGQS